MARWYDVFRNRTSERLGRVRARSRAEAWRLAQQQFAPIVVVVGFAAATDQRPLKDVCKEPMR